jgi:hypothetical protein
VWTIECPRLVQRCFWIEEELGWRRKRVALEGEQKKMVVFEI